MRHSAEYDAFKEDAKKFAKAGRDIAKSGSKLWWKITKEWGKKIGKLTEKTYRNLKERWDSLKAKTKRDLLIVLAAGGIAWGAGIAYKAHSPQLEKTAPKIEQTPTTPEDEAPEAGIKQISYKELASKKFGVKLL